MSTQQPRVPSTPDGILTPVPDIVARCDVPSLAPHRLTDLKARFLASIRAHGRASRAISASQASRQRPESTP